MPHDFKIRYKKNHCRFTKEELRSIGIKEEEFYTEWENPNVSVEETTNSHGTAIAVSFPWEDTYYQVIIGYHHEDWDGTNDLQGNWFEAVEVEPKQVMVTKYYEKRYES